MIKTIKIGTHIIESPVFLAPMSGISDKPFRNIVKKFGVGLTFSEMITSNESIINTNSVAKKILSTNEERIKAVQIIGHNPIDMQRSALWCINRGADIIDINFGCPAKKITNKLCGSAIMKDFTLAKNIISSVVKISQVPVTLKMRLGWDSENLNACEIGYMAQQEGVSLITIHARTREQFYKGKANWNCVRNIKRKLSIPLIINGDIKSLNDAKESLEQSGADGLMIGRGAIGKPWFLNQVIEFLKNGNIIESPSFEIQKKTVLEHFRDIVNHHGEKRGIRTARKHFIEYIKYSKNSYDVRKQILQMENKDEIVNLIEKYYNELI
jgi:tRNA-dihydrouridine synthase B